MINALLFNLPQAERALVEALAKPRVVREGIRIVTDGTPIEAVWFPESALFSIRAANSSGISVEAGLAGRDDIVGEFALLAENRAPYAVEVAVGGTALCVEVDALLALRERMPMFHVALLEQSQKRLRQMSETAATQAKYPIIVRVARWLRDRFALTETSDLRITHAKLAELLGVRRAGVTEALQRLEGSHAIRARRNRIELRDRAALYSVAEGRKPRT